MWFLVTLALPEESALVTGEGLTQRPRQDHVTPSGLWVNPMECVCISLQSSRHGHTNTCLTAVKCKPHHGIWGHRAVRNSYMAGERRINRYFPCIVRIVIQRRYFTSFWSCFMLLTRARQIQKHTCKKQNRSPATVWCRTRVKRCNLLKEKHYWRFASFFGWYFIFCSSVVASLLYATSK